MVNLKLIRFIVLKIYLINPKSVSLCPRLRYFDFTPSGNSHRKSALKKMSQNLPINKRNGIIHANKNARIPSTKIPLNIAGQNRYPDSRCTLTVMIPELIP